MINKEAIDELKKSHSEIFAAKMSVLKDEQMVATVILAQIEQDKLNPPENAAKASVRNALQVVITHTERAELAKEELDKVIQSVRAQFPEIDLGEVDFVLLPSDGEGSAAIIEGLREQLKAAVAGNELLLGKVSDQRAQAEKDNSVINGLTAELKASHDLLEGSSNAAVATLITQLRSASNIKEVREMFTAYDAATASKE